MQKLLSEADLAELTGRSRSSWQKDRFYRRKNSIPYIRVGRFIRYRLEDVEAWLQKNSVVNGGDQLTSSNEERCQS